MCKLKSCLVLEDRIFCPDYDSHDRMLEELKIEDTTRNASTLFIRVELSPKDGDIFSDIDSWGFHVDQDIRPDWFFEELEKPKVVEAVKEWAKKHIFIGETGIELPADGIYYLKNCKSATARENSEVTAYDNSTVTAYDNSKATARDNSTVDAWNNSTVTARENSEVTAYDNSTVTAYDNSKVTAYDNSKVTACENSKVTACENSKVTAYDNSTVTACENSTVTACENSKVTARENSTVAAWDNSTVTAWKNSIVILENNIFRAKRESIVLMDNSTLKDCATKTIYQAGGWNLVVVVQEQEDKQ